MYFFFIKKRQRLIKGIGKNWHTIIELDLIYSSTYNKGTIIIAMAHNNDKIKVSIRIVGSDPKSRNLAHFLDSITDSLDNAISGGHKHAAGCSINLEDEEKFIELVKRKLEFELIKV